MIGYDEALATIIGETRRLEAVRVPANQSLGRVLAAPVTAPECLPPFDNTAMDGFALRVEGERLAAGTELDVTGSQAAGDAHVHAGAGAWEIMTGASLPEGANAVIPVEQVDVLSSTDGRPVRIRLAADVMPSQHVRRRGEDVMQGDQVMRAGELLQPQHLMMLAALGVSDVDVVRRPRVAVITTGRELVDDPAQPLAPGQIRNSNGPLLAARIAAAGAEVVLCETVSDEPDAFLAALARGLQLGADVVLSTGAVSMGRYDFVPEALQGIGAHIHFHKVRIRPGKPLLFARLAGGPLYFGLPGNPVSSAVGLRFFVEPALRVMLGMPLERPLQVPLAGDYVKRVPLRMHLKARVTCDASGQLRVSVLAGQESFRIRPLLAANAWAVVPEDAGNLAAGTSVDVYGLGHVQAPQLGDQVW